MNAIDYCGSFGPCSKLRQHEGKIIGWCDDLGWFIISSGIQITNCPWCGWQLPKRKFSDVHIVALEA